MISAELGKRYERLLFFTAPISLAAIIVCLVAIASATQKERVEARCYIEAAEVFGQKQSQLFAGWTKAKQKDAKSYDYQLLLSKIWIYGSDLSDCYDFIAAEIDEGLFKVVPQKLPEELIARADRLRETPLSVYGIALPKDAAIDLVVATVKIDLLTLTRVLQVVLLPVLLLWLGSLYSTRYRESLTTYQAASLTEVFPHIINMYPAFDEPIARKRDSLAPYAKPIACFVYACTRVGLLLIFIAPPVVAYLYSLYLGATERFSYFYVAAGVIVSLFLFTTVIAEFLPTHYSKLFPDPTPKKQF